MMRGASNNIIEFRKAIQPAGNGRAPFISANLPCDTEPRAFHATESLGETLVRQRNNALYWHAWLNGWAFGALLFSVAGLLWWPR